MDTSELLMNLERFLRDQRMKITADKERIEKSTSPLLLADEISFVQNSNTESGIRFESSTCQTEISLPEPKPFNSSNLKSMLDHPKYGLPGIGEFQDKYEILEREKKRELNEILSEAIREKERERYIRSAPVDYDELLARKRDEEYRYRNANKIDHFPVREAFSGGYLDTKIPRNNYQFERPSISTNSALDELANLLSRLQNYSVADHSERLPLYDHPDVFSRPIYNPPQDFLPRYNSTVHNDLIPEKQISKPIVGVVPQQRDDSRKSMQERQRSELYRRELEEQIREQKERKKRILAEERTDIISNNLPDGFFTTRTPQDNKSYQSQLLQQIEDGKLRKAKQERDSWEMRSNHMEALSKAQQESVHTTDGVRKVPDKWHDGHWPLPENRDNERRKLNYQEELRIQIEEKKRRERQEKEEQRLEEEKLTRRLEEQRKKIEQEFLAEQEKQRIKEEEARSAATALIEEQERKRLEQERKRKGDVEKEWWEKKKEEIAPPIKSQCETRLKTPRQSETRLKTPRQSETLPQINVTPTIVHSRPLSPVKPKESVRLAPADSQMAVTTKTSVLGQLSAMRRQLQQEQERISKRNHDDEDDYQVFDPRLNRVRVHSRRHRVSPSFDVLDVQQIEDRNRQRRHRLQQWQSSDYDTSSSER